MSYIEGPVTASSSWVVSFGFWIDDDPRGGISKFMGRNLSEGIVITFKSGARCYYEGTSINKYKSLLRASSKGKWVNNNLRGTPYRLI